jgi:putative transposase
VPQSLAMVYLHVVFSTKHREPTLADEWRDELFVVLGGAANAVGCQPLAVGGVADHVHLLIRLGRTVTVADAVSGIKSTSSAWVNRTRAPAGVFRWQGGYAAFSVSQSNVEAVREYVRRQPEHHATRTFQDELRAWLRKYGIEWDERYVWD